MLSSVVIAVLTTLPAAGDEFRDEMNPRSPSTPLEIPLGPWYCAVCVAEERIPDQEREVEVMKMPASQLAKAVDLSKNWGAVETPHYTIMSTLKKSSLKFKDGVFVRSDIARLRTIFPDLKVGHDGVRLDPHERLHMYHVRAERIYAHFAAVAGNKEPFLGMPRRYEVFLFQSYAEHHAFVDRFIGSAFDKGGVQWHFREKPNFISLNLCGDLVESKHGKGDAIMGNAFMHNIIHNLIDGCDGYLRETWAWLEEGLGHYYERRETPRYNNFCWAEGAPPTEFYKPNWESTILAKLRRDKDEPFTQWCEKLKPGELNGTEHGLSWGMVKWLIETEPLRFAKLLKYIDDQSNPNCSDSIQGAFGVSPSVLYQRWRDYALENYGKKR